MPAHVVKVHPENLWRRHFWNRYRGLLPVATMLEKLGFQALVEETLRCSRETRAMSLYKFVLGSRYHRAHPLRQSDGCSQELQRGNTFGANCAMATVPRENTFTRAPEECDRSAARRHSSLSARADSGFYCAEAVQAYEEGNCGFVIVARKTARVGRTIGTGDMEAFAENGCPHTHSPAGSLPRGRDSNKFT